MDIWELIAKNIIVKIGIDLPEHIYSEVIVSDPIECIHLVLENNCYISSIMWWERVEVEAKPQIGYGGVLDPREPNRFFFAETDIGEQFGSATTEDEYCRYLKRINSDYSYLDMIPAFEVSRKR